MSEKADQLLSDALDLPLDERATLAAELISSIDGEAEDGAEEAWAKEIEKRAERTRRGEARSADWDSVRERIEHNVLKK